MRLNIPTLAEWLADGQEGLLSVVIPAHNEEHHLPATVRQLHQALEEAAIPHEILVINDNSRDRTPEVLRELEGEIPVLRHRDNPPPNGFGYAVRHGLTHFNGEVVVIVMADGSDAPEDVVAFYRKLQEGYDCIFGTRFSQGGGVEGYPWPKLILNRLVNNLIRLLFMVPYDDTTNAFKMYRRTVIAGIQPLVANHFNLTVELSLKSITRGYRIGVVPNGWRNRKEGVSKFRIQEMGSRYLFIILYCWLERILIGREFPRQRGSGEG